MLSKVRIYNEADEYLEFPLGVSPTSGGYSIRSIDGLGPVKAEVSYSDYALLPGGVFHSANTGIRNIVLRAGYTPDYASNQTVQSMRKDLYSIAIPGRKVRLYFYDDGVWTYWIDGYVETHEPSIFTIDPEVQISILCVDTTFASPNNTSLTGVSGTNTIIQYAGDAPRGFIFEATLGSAVTWFQVRRHVSGGNQIVQVNRALAAGSRIRIQLERGYKGASLVNSSGMVLENLMGRLQIVNDWPELIKGTNSIGVSASAGTVSYKITYRDHYLGI